MGINAVKRTNDNDMVVPAAEQTSTSDDNAEK
jgi:hypothetical protein